MMIQNSFYLLNPNKQTYVWELSSQYLRLKVQRNPSPANAIQPLLKKRGYHQLGRLDTATVWEIGFSACSNPHLLCEKMIVSSSHHQGLLVNPLFETYSFF
jgi:phosphoribosylformylglycinamidine (FGAM) synthase PurS component